MKAFASLEGFGGRARCARGCSRSRGTCAAIGRGRRARALVIPIEDAHALAPHDPLGAAVAMETEARCAPRWTG